MKMSRGNHPIQEEELMAYLDGELSDDRAAVAVTHLAQCQHCQKVADDLRSISRSLRAWQIEPSTPEMMPSIQAELDVRGEHLEKATTVKNGTWWRSFQSQWARGGGFSFIAVLVGVGLCLWLGILSMSHNENTVFSSVAHSINEDDGLAESLKIERPPNQTAGRVGDGQESDLRNGNGPIVGGPMIVRTAKLTMTTTAFEKARIDLENILKVHRGYLGDLNVAAPAGMARTLNVSLHVPTDQLEGTMTQLRQLGRVESESQSGENVTSQYVDLQARLSNARNTEGRLTDLLRQRTGKLADVLAVETEISRVRGDIERMEVERKNLSNQVEFATVNATVKEDYKAHLQMMPPATFTQIRNAAIEGYRTVIDGIVSLATFLAWYGPSILFWGALLFFPTRRLWKTLRSTMRRPTAWP
jgi:Domain of unknown function (DUF4349)/Putative zinc-finger